MKPELKTFFLTGGFFAFFMFFCFWFTSKNIYAAAVTASIAGLVFALSMRCCGTVIQRRFEACTPPPDTDETILHSSPANHMRGLEGVGGFLYLTSHRLLFRPHSFNIQKEELSVPLSTIGTVSFSKKTWGLLSNRLTVTDNSASQYAFIVYYPKVWVEKLTPPSASH